MEIFNNPGACLVPREEFTKVNNVKRKNVEHFHSKIMIATLMTKKALNDHLLLINLLM